MGPTLKSFSNENIKCELTFICRKTAATNDTFCMVSSVMHRFAMSMPREPKWFKACAEGYLLSGRLNDICDHNATVARNAGRNDVSKHST